MNINWIRNEPFICHLHSLLYITKLNLFGMHSYQSICWYSVFISSELVSYIIVNTLKKVLIQPIIVLLCKVHIISSRLRTATVVYPKPKTNISIGKIIVILLFSKTAIEKYSFVDPFSGTNVIWAIFRLVKMCPVCCNMRGRLLLHYVMDIPTLCLQWDKRSFIGHCLKIH